MRVASEARKGLPESSRAVTYRDWAPASRTCGSVVARSERTVSLVSLSTSCRDRAGPASPASTWPQTSSAASAAACASRWWSPSRSCRSMAGRTEGSKARTITSQSCGASASSTARTASATSSSRSGSTSRSARETSADVTGDSRHCGKRRAMRPSRSASYTYPPLTRPRPWAAATGATRRNSSTLGVHSRRAPSGRVAARSASVPVPSVVSNGRTRAARSSMSSSWRARARTARWCTRRNARRAAESSASVVRAHARTWAPRASRVASSTSSS